MKIIIPLYRNWVAPIISLEIRPKEEKCWKKRIKSRDSYQKNDLYAFVWSKLNQSSDRLGQSKETFKCYPGYSYNICYVCKN
jgi:hypothetical protein